jgi:thymidine kinase
MKSGKSTKLIQELDKHYYAKKKCLLLRPLIDSREDTSRFAVLPNYIKVRKIAELKEFCSMTDSGEFDVVGIDEGQFFPDLDFVNVLASAYEVYVAALHATSEAKPWPSVQSIIPVVDDIEFCHAVCEECGAKAAWVFNGNKNETIKIGDSEYKALCRTCWGKATTGLS